MFLFTLLMITREGMETALLMGTLLFQEAGPNIMIGAVAGTLCSRVRRVAVVALRPPRQPGAVLPGDGACSWRSSSCSSFIYGFHELTEANIFPYSEPLHWATEPYGTGRPLRSDSRPTRCWLLPLGWLAICGALRRQAEALPFGVTADSHALSAEFRCKVQQ